MINARDMQVHEILTDVEKGATFEQQVATLRRYKDHQPLQYVLKWNYDSSIKTVLPEGRPPFNEFDPDAGPAPRSLWDYLDMFPIFVKSGRSMEMKMLQIEKNFIDLLENVDSAEADVIIATKDKQLHQNFSIEPAVIKEAFPDLLFAPEVVEVVQKSPEEKANQLIELANQKKEQAKQLNAEAKELIKEAKELAGE